MSHPASVSNLDSLHTPWPGPITANGRPELRLGSTDPDPADGPVRYLQRLLRDRGYEYVLVNGLFDRLTLAAVEDFQLRQLSLAPPPPASPNTDNVNNGTVVDDATWEALLAMAPESFTAQPGQSTLLPCPLGTNQLPVGTNQFPVGTNQLPPDLLIPGRSRHISAGEPLPAQVITAYQYTHFSPQSATWANYPFRDDQGQLPQLQRGDADPQGSVDGPIRQLQAFLQDNGYYKGEVNGRFEQELHDVVVAYQTSHPSLLPDGVINAADWAQLLREDRQDATASGTTASGTADVTSNMATRAVPLATPLVLDARVAATIVDLSDASMPIGPAPVLPAPSVDSDASAEAFRKSPTSVTYQHPWLRLHATDDDLPNSPIRQLQRLLFVIGQGVPLTGVFDVATEQAVRQFQSAFPELTDPPGEVGPNTWAKLEQEAAKPLDPLAILGAAEAVTAPLAPLPMAPDLNLAWDEPVLASSSEPTPAIATTPIAPSPIAIVDLAAPPLTHRVDVPPVDLSPVNVPPVDLSPVDLSPVDLSPVDLTIPPATAITATSVLQKGQTDTAANGPIAHLQTLLNEYGYVLTVDGQFNEATFQAVSNFQYSHDLPPTGVVDRATWEVLMGQDTTDPAASSPPLPAPPADPDLSPPAWDVLMGDVSMGVRESAVDAGPVPPAMEPADEATVLLAAVPPLDVALPAELTALPSVSAAAPTARSLPPDPLMPSATPPSPNLALVDLYAQGDAVLSVSQQQALQWLSQQVPTATLTEFQQRWHTQGSGT